jgi:predicted nucleic acid-binding protein
MTKVYLDLCAIQRPLDTPSQVRVALEAEAVLGTLSLCDAGQIELISSEALVYESEQNPFPIRREHSYSVLAKAKTIVRVTASVKERASQFLHHGVKPLDAVHLALAEASKADYFCTCDDQLARRARCIRDLQVKVISPLDLIQEIEK